jgi:hypothetical protein
MNSLKKLFQLCGIQIRTLKSVEYEARKAHEVRWAEEYRFVGNARIQTLLDLGAGAGVFARVARRAFPPLAEIHSFEENPELRDQLKNALDTYRGHIVHDFLPGLEESLDDWAKDRVLLPDILLRIVAADPMSVLTGAEMMLKRVRFLVIHLELSSDSPHSSGFRQINDALYENGFVFRGHAGQSMDEKTKALVSDLIYEQYPFVDEKK